MKHKMFKKRKVVYYLSQILFSIKKTENRFGMSYSISPIKIFYRTCFLLLTIRSILAIIICISKGAGGKSPQHLLYFVDLVQLNIFKT